MKKKWLGLCSSMNHTKKNIKRKFQGVYVLEMANTILESVSYCDSLCGCGVKKNKFWKITFFNSWCGWSIGLV
jgi:hypothetical protein